MSSTKKISVGIVGGAGYTAGELLRILLNHPQAEVTFVQSDSQVGKTLTEVHKDLVGETELEFTDQLSEVDVIFLCRGHGASRKFMESTTIPGQPKIIDLSHDYRLATNGNNFIYGLPEALPAKLSDVSRIANPGCFATCIQLGLLPLAKKSELKNDIHVTAITGSTGAGQSLSGTSHFSWRNNNLSVYKPFQHQHLDEIKQTLAGLQLSPLPEINFVPIRGNFTRGIFASIYMDTDLSSDELETTYQEYYSDHPFTHVVRSNPDLKQVVGTNKGLVYVDKIDGKALIISMIDNLIKGASGQAVQNMNLMFGLEETMGLKLRAIAF